MDRIPEEIVKLAESGEVKLKTTKPQEVASTVHKGAYQELNGVFWKLAHWIEENGYEIVGPSVTVCYNDPHNTSEEELACERPFLVWNRENRLECVGIEEKKKIIMRS
jgi:effector-binding domain-containing protein